MMVIFTMLFPVILYPHHSDLRIQNCTVLHSNGSTLSFAGVQKAADDQI